jgi:hypothetical protein
MLSEPLKGFNVWWPMEGKEEVLFHFKVLLYHGFTSLFMHFLPFLWPINYNHTSRCSKSSTHSSSIWFWLKIFFLFLEIMASHMATVYGPQVAQVNEESTLKSFLDLILTSHPCDEDSKLWEVRARFWSWSPLSLILSHFSKLSHSDNFVASWPRFWW